MLPESNVFTVVCLSTVRGGARLTITHDALDLTTTPTPDTRHKTHTSPYQKWYLPRPVLTSSGGHRNMYAWKPGSMLPSATVILSTGGMSASGSGGGPFGQTTPLPPQADNPSWAGTPPGRDTPAPAPDGHCSRRYASYWNAFLFFSVFTL